MPRSANRLGALPIVLAILISMHPTFSQEATSDLRIVIIEGDGFTNNVKKRTARESIVEVHDRNDKPVAGVAVSFELPGSGPGGAFVHGGRIFTSTTDQFGRASASALKANNHVGVFKIHVNASLQGHVVATATITQTNVLAGATAGVAAAGGLFGIGVPATIGIAAAVAAGTAIAVAKGIGGHGGGKTATVSVGGPHL